MSTAPRFTHPHDSARRTRATGHDVHFLERLDRVKRAHVEFALSLYRDRELMLFVLRNASIPRDTERVAISLDHPKRGPFIIVARDGGFVTCLGEGMGHGPWPVVTRAEFDALRARLEETRRRMNLARTIAGPARDPHEVLELAWIRADGLSREEFLAITAWQPMIEPELLVEFVRAAADCGDLRDVLLKRVMRGVAPMHERCVETFGKAVWGLGHVFLLATMGRATWLEKVAEIWTTLDWTPSYMLVRENVMALAVRGAWGTARLGPTLIPRYVAALAGAEDTTVAFDAMLGLTAIGVRHPEHRATVQKALTAPCPNADGATRGEYARAYRSFASAALLAINEPRRAIARVIEFGRRHMNELARGMPDARFARPTDVPDDLALAAAMNHPGDTGNDYSIAAMALLAVAHAARAEPEELYFPMSVAKDLRTPWTVDRSLALLRRWEACYGKEEPIRALPAPGRNDPCPCASGKKYKRCCGT